MVSVGARPVCKEQQQHHHARRGRRDHGTRPRLVHRSTSKLASWSPSNSDMLTSNFMVNWDGFDYGTLRPMWPLWYHHTIGRGRYTEEQGGSMRSRASTQEL